MQLAVGSLKKCAIIKVSDFFVGALAEFERDLIRERTLAGLAAAKVRGRVGGRPRKAADGKVALARHLYQNSKHSVAETGATKLDAYHRKETAFFSRLSRISHNPIDYNKHFRHVLIQ